MVSLSYYIATIVVTMSLLISTFTLKTYISKTSTQRITEIKGDMKLGMDGISGYMLKRTGFEIRNVKDCSVLSVIVGNLG